MSLLTQCGCRRCLSKQLLTIPEPDKTQSYTPLNHYDFAVNVRSVTSDLLRDFSFLKDDYALSTDGQKMFGVLTFTEQFTFDDNFLSRSIGLRNPTINPRPSFLTAMHFTGYFTKPQI